jgi:hypothetical protein
LKVNATLGAQQVESPGFSQVTPVYNVGINYDILGDGKTSANLSTYRSYHASAQLRNQAYWSNGVVVSASRQIGSRTQFLLALGYEFADYSATAAGVTATREDSFYYIRPQISIALTTHAGISLYYQYSKDDSTGFGASSFESNSVGVMANLSF